MKKMIFINAMLLFGAAAANYKRTRELDHCRRKADKALREMKLFEQWLFVKQDGKRFADYFRREKIRTIAIYGMGTMGERLYDELRDQDVTVAYAIDQKGKRVCSDLEVYSNTDLRMLKKVDAVVVTAVHCYEEVRKRITAEMEVPALSLEEILYEM